MDVHVRFLDSVTNPLSRFCLPGTWNSRILPITPHFIDRKTVFIANLFGWPQCQP